MSDEKSPFHTAGKGAVAGMFFVGEAEFFENFVDVGLVVFDAVIAGLEKEGFVDGEERVEGDFLGNDTEEEFGFLTMSCGVEAADFDRAGSLAFGAGEDRDEAGFAGAVWSEEGEEFALLDGEAEVVHGRITGIVCFVEVFNF